MTKIVLASGSPRRQELLARIGITDFDIRVPEAEESYPAAEAELRAYIATGEPMDKAGSYGVQGKGALLVEKLNGDFFNVMGLPVLRLSRMLAQFGVNLL